MDIFTEIYNSSSTDADLIAHDTYYLSLAREDVIKTVYMCISMFGAPANLMAIIAIITSPRMRTKPFNILIIHQSFADFCACGCIFVVQLTRPSYVGLLGKILDKFNYSLHRL